MAESDKAPDPKALEVKYTYPDAAKDDAAIKKVETAIVGHNILGFATGLASKADNAPVSKEEYEEQTKEAREKEAQERLLHPDKVKEEEKQDASPKGPTGTAVKPSIQSVNPPKAGAHEPPKGGKGEAAKPHPKGGKPSGPPGAAPSLKPPRELALAAASSSDGDLDKWLNNYPHKSTETTERLSKISEMAGVANSFDGQVEKYVAEGDGKLASAKAGMINFLGKKEMGAIFGHNPYDNVQGGLGSFMRFLSVFQNVVSIVGNICSKVGMVLTVLGLIGMILGPIGVAVSAIARVLNVVGIVCDALGFALSGVLAGLNGVVLAKQIGAGASNEEKAATADMMMTEATSAGGHVLSLAMSYGPGFMKGFKNASKGVISKLFSGIKSKIGTFATKALGPVGNWAKNVGYKMGFGLAEKTGEGLLSKAWNAPGSLIKRARSVGWVSKLNNSDFAKAVEQKAAKFENMGWVNKVDGLGEKMGAGVGNWNESAGKEFKVGAKTFKPEQFAKNAEAEFDHAVGSIAGKDAGNKARVKIDNEIKATREIEINQIDEHMDESGYVPKENVQASKAARRKADNLERTEEGVVANTEKTTADRASEEHHDKGIEKRKEEHEEDKHIEDWRKDPEKFQQDTEVKQIELDLAEKQTKATNITDDQRKFAEETAKDLKKEIEERQMIPFKSGGMEAPGNLWEAYNYQKEWREAWNGKNGNAEKVEDATKHVENYEGGHAGNEKREKAEQVENIEEWSKGEAPEIAVFEHVEGMLEGVDEDEEHEGDEHEGDEHEGSDGGDGGGDEMKADDDSGAGDVDAASASSSDSAPDAAPPSNDNVDAAPANDGGGVAASGAGSGSEAPQPDAAPAAKPAAASAPPSEDEKAAEVPELVYWPKLVIGSDAEFAKSAKQLMRMKQVAFAFQKSQLEARKKALETVATLATSTKDGNLRQAHAMDHSIGINGSVEEATKSGAAANTSSQHAGEGVNQQTKGAGNANTPAGAGDIDIGGKPSLLHPIKRIWWYVKRWAKNIAAKVFGWIQDQIASLVLRLLCGVSMQDMRDYTTALHHRMDFSKGVGQQGLGTTAQVKAKAAKQVSDSGKYSDEALDDAKECDKNVHDADKFVQDIESTEQDLQKQQAAAKQFLADLNTAVAAERAKKTEEKNKAAADAAKAQQGPAGTPAPASGATPPSPPPPAAKVAAAPIKNSAKPGKKKKPTDGQEKKISAKSVQKVQNAASYVTSQTSIVVNQLTKSKEEQFGKMRSKFENKKSAGPIVAKLKTGDSVLQKATEAVRNINAEMAAINSMSPANANVLHQQAGKIKSGAKELDSIAKEAQESLNYSFKLTYDKINRTREISAYI